MTAGIINIFKEKISSIPEGETPDQTITKFHDKLDEVMQEFHKLSAYEKGQIMESVITMNKQIFEMYWDLRKRLGLVN